MVRFKLLNFFIFFTIGLSLYIILIADPEVLFYPITATLIIMWVFPPLIIALTILLIFINFWLGGKKIVIHSREDYAQQVKKANRDVVLNFTDRVEVRQYKLPSIDKSITYSCLITDLQYTDFGFWLTREENEWLAQEINSFLAKD